ncbi:iron-containing alcohol dehydrogenase [Candidatus Villigracilis affinis]|uniref:iron-containing alcohol dehydrogenase n=1 Tax=Candidatus Villigracilis affinis TaxID=3140682 RepID=UPI001D97BBEB|nr:iron-containing alcohol dehydrogenase [Anaerolineales bacterium]MBL0346207.1 iron-containing alcohol dehydrogenase [Anaerolineales bacterium]
MKRIPNLPVVHNMPFSEIDEKRSVLLVTSAPAWNAVKANLRGLNIIETIEVAEATTDYWDNLQSSIANQKSEIVYAVGGGLVADASKYIASKLNLPLVVLPTALSVDAFITAASGIRRDGCVYYMETKVPETLILDLDTIAKAPASIRAAGITDVMSIATGAWDWKFAHERGMNPAGMEFIPWVYDNAQSILSGVLDCAEAAGRGDKDGLKTLYDCLAMEVQLCNQVGHSRPEEGSEHYFAYAVENEMGHGLPHGDLVGPGIMIMSKLQDQAAGPLEAALKACNIPLDRIPPEVVKRTLAELPVYCEKHGLAFGLAHTLGKQ